MDRSALDVSATGNHDGHAWSGALDGSNRRVGQEWLDAFETFNAGNPRLCGRREIDFRRQGAPVEVECGRRIGKGLLKAAGRESRRGLLGTRLYRKGLFERLERWSVDGCLLSEGGRGERFLGSDSFLRAIMRHGDCMHYYFTHKLLQKKLSHFHFLRHVKTAAAVLLAARRRILQVLLIPSGEAHAAACHTCARAPALRRA